MASKLFKTVFLDDESQEKCSGLAVDEAFQSGVLDDFIIKMERELNSNFIGMVPGRSYPIFSFLFRIRTINPKPQNKE